MAGHPCLNAICPEYLITGIPSRIASFTQKKNTALISGTHVIIHGEKVAELIKRHSLRVANSFMKKFQFRTVWIASENAAFKRTVQSFSLSGFYIIPTVSNIKIEFAVHTPDRSMQVVTVNPDSNSESFSQSLFFAGFQINTIKTRDAGEVGIAVSDSHTGGGPGKKILEIVCDDF